MNQENPAEQSRPIAEEEELLYDAAGEIANALFSSKTPACRGNRVDVQVDILRVIRRFREAKTTTELLSAWAGVAGLNAVLNPPKESP